VGEKGVCCSEVEGSGEATSTGEMCFCASVDMIAADGVRLKVSW